MTDSGLNLNDWQGEVIMIRPEIYRFLILLLQLPQHCHRANYKGFSSFSG